MTNLGGAEVLLRPWVDRRRRSPDEPRRVSQVLAQIPAPTVESENLVEALFNYGQLSPEEKEMFWKVRGSRA